MFNAKTAIALLLGALIGVLLSPISLWLLFYSELPSPDQITLLCSQAMSKAHGTEQELLYLGADGKTYERPVGNIPTSRQLVYTAVLVTSDSLSSTGEALYDTWGKQMGEHFGMFVVQDAPAYQGTADAKKAAQTDDEGQENLEPQRPYEPRLPLRSLNRTLPKSAHRLVVLSHACKHVSVEYEFVLLSRDDVYVRVHELEKLLRGLNPSALLYLGHSSPQTTSDCISGPGVVFSRAALQRVCPLVEQCLSTASSLTPGSDESAMEDYVLGNCVHRLAGLQCLYTPMMNNLFYYKDSGNSLPFTAVTVYRLTTSDQFYLLHDLVSRVRLQDLMKETTVPIADQGRAQLKTGMAAGQLWPWFESHKNPKSKYELLTWNYFNSSLLFLSYEHQPVMAIPARLREGINKALQIVVEKMNTTEGEEAYVPPYTLMDGYLSVDEAMGIEYHLRMSLTRKSLGLPVKYLAQVFLPFAGPGMSVYRESSLLEGTTVHLIVPIGNQVVTPFLEYYETVCLKNPLPIQLHLVFFSHDEPIRRKITQIRDVYSHAVIHVHEIQGQRFSYSAAYTHVSNLLSDNSLMIFFDVSFEFSLSFLTHCRMNAVQGHQAYFPILFSLYQPELLERESHTMASMLVSPDTGFFLRYNYQVAAIYKSDFVSVGGFQRSSTGTSKESEDMVFVNNILRTDIYLMRALEPNLWRKFQRRRCDILQGNAQKSCYNSLADSVGSKKTLGGFVVTQNLIDTI